MAREHVTSTIPPPAERITPAIARAWLRRVYPKLASFTELGYFEDALRPPRLRQVLRSELASLALDTRRIATACAEAVGTGRPVKIRLARPYRAHPALVRWLRAVVAFEQRCSRTKRTGVRGVLLATLRRMERDVAEARSRRLAEAA